jgi:4a-hydroxytetrahydrobiopterin dehydratase
MTLHTFLEQNSQWKQEENTLTGEFTFDGFSGVSAAIQQCMQLAKKLDHHPEATFGYKTIKIVLTTHDAGNLITELDVEFAQTFTQQLW